MFLELSAPIKISGIILCESLDFLRFFDHGGFPPESDYLFLGNYIDQGKQSIETTCFFFADKIKYSDNFFLLPGNHEHIYFLYTIKIKNILQKLYHN